MGRLEKIQMGTGFDDTGGRARAAPAAPLAPAGSDRAAAVGLVLKIKELIPAVRPLPLLGTSPAFLALVFSWMTPKS